MKLKAAVGLAMSALILIPAASAAEQAKNTDAEAIAQADMAMKQNVFAVQLAVERHKADFGTCPDSMQALADEGYLAVMPDNPYASLWSQAPAKCVEEDLSFRPTPGAIVYHPYTLDGDSLGGYIILGAGMKGSNTSGVFEYDLFYGEPRWDSMKYFMPDGKGDGRPESYVIMLSSPSLTPDMAVSVTHDAAWLNAQPDYQAKKALYAMQLAVERYGVDNDVYPPNLQTLIDLGYIYWPVNPYYGLRGAPLRIPACAPEGFAPGGVIYEPIRFDGHIKAYQMGIFGDDPDGGIDAGALVDGTWHFYDLFEEPRNPDGVPDGLIMVLSSGPAPERCETGT